MSATSKMVRLASAVLLLGLFTALTATTVVAQQKSPFKEMFTVEGITEYRLPNSVRLLLFPDPSASTVTVNMTIFVGSRHEGYGETGMAHLLEHMLFKGSKNFPKTISALNSHGAAFNGTTWVDRTNYFETMPATDENLKFGIMLEADRLVNCFIRREDLTTEMTVVRNEFERGENNPSNILSQRMAAVAFEWHNYGKSTIGNRSDIERVPIENLRGFYRKYYRPDNMMLVIAGKYDQKKAMQYVAQYFGSIPRPKTPVANTYTEEPVQDGERKVVLRRTGSVGVAAVLYHIPAGRHADYPAVEILESLLDSSPSGRLYKALVEAKKATRVSGSAFAWHDPGVLEISAPVAAGVEPQEVLSIMTSLLDDLPQKPITEKEVDRAKAELLSQYERAITKSKTIAIAMSEWAGAGDWRLMFLHRDRLKKVTAEDVNRVVAKYLKPSNRTVGLFLPTKAEQIARAKITQAPSAKELLKGYKGNTDIAMGEAFDPTPANIEKRVKRFTLPTGVKVAYLEKKTRGEAVVGQLTLRFGNEKSLKGLNTAAGYMGTLMMRGTKKLSRQEIRDKLDSLGASLSASSGLGQITFSWQAKRKTMPALLDLLHQILREPTFPEDEFGVIKREQIQSLKKNLTDPIPLAITAMRRKMTPYPKSDIRYVPTISESIEDVEKTTRDDVVGLYKKQLGGSVGEIALVGDFDANEVTAAFEGMLAGWKSTVHVKRIEQSADTKVAGSRQDILTPDKKNAIFLAGETFKLKDTDPVFPALRLGMYILGGSPTARLFEELRQKRGLSYTAMAQVSVSSQDPYGAFFMFAICNPDNMNKADKAALGVLSDMLKNGVSADELGKAQKGYLQKLQVSRASDSTLAGMLSQGLYIDRTFEYYANLEKSVEGLTTSDVNQAMRKYVNEKRLVVVRGGDLKKQAEKK